MIQSNLVVGVKECQAALDFVCLDHSLQDLLDCNDLSIAQVSSSTVCTRDPVCDSQNGTQVVRRVAPFCSQPAVIVVQPSDHSTNVESSINRVELERCAGHLGAIWDVGPWDDWAEQFRALFEAETFETAAKSVEEDESCCIELCGASISYFHLGKGGASSQPDPSL